MSDFTDTFSLILNGFSSVARAISDAIDGGDVETAKRLATRAGLPEGLIIEAEARKLKADQRAKAHAGEVPK